MGMNGGGGAGEEIVSKIERIGYGSKRVDVSRYEVDLFCFVF